MSIPISPVSREERIVLAAGLAPFISGDRPEWDAAIQRALNENPWFTEESIRQAAAVIANQFLNVEKLQSWAAQYPEPEVAKTVGLVLAGNIPLVGFQDVLCVFISGHRARIKPGTKDRALITAMVQELHRQEPRLTHSLELAEGNIAGCDAYIATGSNNTARYFESYFEKYPHIIRKNRTSVAVLTGAESMADLQGLATDIFQYFGLGCRNVTQLCVPRGYDFEPLLKVLGEAGKDLPMMHKWKNNYDYHLAIFLLNRVPYLSNEVVLLTENKLPHSAPAVLHYRYYESADTLLDELRNDENIQAIVGYGGVPFGEAQCPSLMDYADGVDVMQFLAEV